MSHLDNMPAGREMDALVAEKVMGCWVKVRTLGTDSPTRLWSCGCTGEKSHNGPAGSGLLPYSTDIAAAWEVVEKLARPLTLVFHHDGRWDCTFAGGEHALGDTAPLAICRAAAKKGEVKT